jgi:hypothetical protein
VTPEYFDVRESVATISAIKSFSSHKRKMRELPAGDKSNETENHVIKNV